MEEGVQFLCIWGSIQRRVAWGNMSVSPDILWPIFLPLNPLFWDVKLRLTKVAAWRSSSVEVDEKTLWPYMNATSDLDTVHSLECMRNNYMIMIMSHSCRSTDSPEAAATH